MDELDMHDPGRPRNLLKPCAVSPTACDMNTVKLGLLQNLQASRYDKGCCLSTHAKGRDIYISDW